MIDIALILTELITKQDAAYLKNGKYAQLLPSHDVVPDGETNVKVSTVRDEDIRPTVTKLNFAFRVDEIASDDAWGWVLRAWTKKEGQVYTKAWGFALGIGETKDWAPTNIGPGD